MKTGDIYKYNGEYQLVGDINKLGGICDDCSLLIKDTDYVGNIFEDVDLIKLLTS